MTLPVSLILVGLVLVGLGVLMIRHGRRLAVPRHLVVVDQSLARST